MPHSRAGILKSRFSRTVQPWIPAVGIGQPVVVLHGVRCCCCCCCCVVVFVVVVIVVVVADVAAAADAAAVC